MKRISLSVKCTLVAGILSLLPIVASAIGPTISCSTPAAIFNSGYNGNGGRLPSDARLTDAYWEVGIGDDTGPSSVTTWQAAIVKNVVPGVWVELPFNNAEWITLDLQPSTTVIYYRYRFVLAPTVNPADFSLNIDFYVDNFMQKIILNGVLFIDYVDGAYPLGQGAFYEGAQLNAHLNQGWVTGQNEIIIKTWNDVVGGPNNYNPEGLLIQNKSALTCPPKLQISKTTSSTTDLYPNGTVDYTVTVSSEGGSDASGAVVTDNLPEGLVSGTWTCTVALGGAVCPNISGTLPLNETITTFPGDSKLVYTITAKVSAAPPAAITNTVTAIPPLGGTCGLSSTAPPCIASVTDNVKPLPVPPVPPVPPPAAVLRPVPTLSGGLLYLLTVLMLAVAWVANVSRQRIAIK